MKRVVITLHGIRTRGLWQKALVPYLCKIKRRWIIHPLDYGHFSGVSLLLPWRRNRKVEWFLSEYTRIRETEQIARPSVIAHSFGTYIVVHALEKYPQIRFDKVIFCGSIVKTDFDWKSLFDSGQVNLVRNDCGRLDTWAGVARHFVKDAGPSGVGGFIQKHSRLGNHEFKRYTHSSYFNGLHFTGEWVPTLEKVTLERA